MPSREKVVDILQKILAHSASAEKIGNLEEAKTFAAKAQELMLKYKLELSEVLVSDDMKTVEDEPIGEEVFDPYAKGFVGNRRRLYWQEVLAKCVAQAHYCEIMVYRHNNAVMFVGTETDRKLAVRMYAELVRACVRLASKGYRQARAEQQSTDGYYKGFTLGYVHGIRERYYAIGLEQKGTLDKNSKAMVLVDRTAENVRNFMDEKSAGKVHAPKARLGSLGGYNAGKAASYGVEVLGSRDKLSGGE